MTIRKGDVIIDVMIQDCFGKRPGLYVGVGNELLKVGNFATKEKARIFEEYMLYMCSIGPKPKEVEHG